MTAHPLPTHRYTYTQYLALERETGEKWEFFDGEVWPWEAMAGSSPAHARICSRLSGLLEAGLDPSRCDAFSSDIKLSILQLRRYRYPDLAVVCGPVAHDEHVRQAILNPVLIVEVTSDSSIVADYGSKAEQYMKRVPSLRDYLIVNQHEPRATVFSRADEAALWTVRHVSDLGDTFTLAGIGVEISLGEVYRNIDWDVEGRAFVKAGGGIPGQPRERGGESRGASSGEGPA